MNKTNHDNNNNIEINQAMDVFTTMVIEEFLMQKGMKSTLNEFRNEYKRPEEDITMISWYEIALKLRLPDMLEIHKGTVLESIIAALLRESSIRSRRSLEIVSTGLVAQAKSSSLPPIIDGNISQEFIMSSSGIRSPQSKKDDPITETQTKSDASNKIIFEHKTNEKEKEKKKHKSKRHQQDYNDYPLVQRQLELIQLERFGKVKPSAENWVPENIRLRSIYRDIAVAKDTLSDVLTREDTNRKEVKRLSVTALDKAHTEESLGCIKKIPCGCCLQKFLYVNLPLKVSQKAIIDIRKKWSGGLTSATVFGQIEESNENENSNLIEGGEGEGEGEEINEESGTDSLKKKQKKKKPLTDERLTAIPRCYDEVPVCIFCSQFFQKQEAYRPSYMQITYEERLAVFKETRRREKEYWDPLKMCEKDMERELEEERIELEKFNKTRSAEAMHDIDDESHTSSNR